MDKNYSGFGKRLDSLREEGEQKREFADRLGIHYTTLSRCLYNEKPPGRSVLEKISAVTGKSIDWLLGGIPPTSDKTASKSVKSEAGGVGRKIPVVKMARANKFKTKEEVIDFPAAISKDFTITDAKGRYLFGVYVEDDSMEPYFRAGDILIVNTGLKPRNGDYVIAELNKKPMFRKLVQSKGVTILHPLNDRHQDILITSHKTVRIIGKVIERKTLL